MKSTKPVNSLGESLEDIIAERDILKRLLAKHHQRNKSFSIGIKSIRAYFDVNDNLVYGYHYSSVDTTKTLARMGYDSISKAQKGLEYALAADLRLQATLDEIKEQFLSNRGKIPHGTENGSYIYFNPKDKAEGRWVHKACFKSCLLKGAKK